MTYRMIHCVHYTCTEGPDALLSVLEPVRLHAATNNVTCSVNMQPVSNCHLHMCLWRIRNQFSTMNTASSGYMIFLLLRQKVGVWTSSFRPSPHFSGNRLTVKNSSLLPCRFLHGHPLCHKKTAVCMTCELTDVAHERYAIQLGNLMTASNIGTLEALLVALHACHLGVD